MEHRVNRGELLDHMKILLEDHRVLLLEVPGGDGNEIEISREKTRFHA